MSATYPFFPAHRDDLPLEVSARRTPAALVHAKLSQTVVPRILVCFGNYPGWRVRDSQVEHLALDHQVIEALHQLRDLKEPSVSFLIALPGRPD